MRKATMEESGPCITARVLASINPNASGHGRYFPFGSFEMIAEPTSNVAASTSYHAPAMLTAATDLGCIWNRLACTLYTLAFDSSAEMCRTLIIMVPVGVSTTTGL